MTEGAVTDGAVLGVDLGGTNMRVAVVSASGEITSRSVQPTPQDDPSALALLMREVATESSEELRGAVVGVPAVVDYEQGTALRIANIPKWEGRLSARPLANAVGLPVIFANDADLAAVGEHRYGAGRGVADMVYLTISTGVGGGVVLGGRLLHGKRSLAELGHTVIDQREGHVLEALGSGTALGRVSGLGGAEVTSRAEAGDQEALDWFGEVATAFAVGVGNAIECFMPERVVIGGGVSQAGPLLLDPVRAYLATVRAGELLDPANVVLATGGDDVGLRGAYPLWEDAESPREPTTVLAPFYPEAGGGA